MNSSRYKYKQLKHLSFLLKCKPFEIEKILENIDRFYGNRVETKLDKNDVPKKYSDGTIKTRTLNPSYNRLKELQSKIKTEVLDIVDFPSHIQGGVRGKSNITNGKTHQGNYYVLTTDLQNFFPSVSNSMVYNLFLKLGYSNIMANYLTKLTTYKYKLPQGTPTSTHIANLVSLELDKELLSLCKEWNIAYSRFVDDLTFSAPHSFAPVIDNILQTITDFGFKISRRKTHYEPNQTITGIKVFNNYIDVPRKIKEKAELEALKDAKVKPYSWYRDRVRSTNSPLLK